MKRITIMAAGRHAADMVYGDAKAGNEVTWINRQFEIGLAAFIDTEGHGRYINASEIGHTYPLCGNGITVIRIRTLYKFNTALVNIGGNPNKN